MDFFVCSCLLIYLFLYKFEFIFLEAYFILIFYLVLHIMLFQYFSMMSQGLSNRVHSLVTWYIYTSDALLGFLCIVTVQHCWLCYANDSLCYDVNKLSFVHFIKWTDITVTAVFEHTGNTESCNVMLYCVVSASVPSMLNTLTYIILNCCSDLETIFDFCYKLLFALCHFLYLSWQDLNCCIYDGTCCIYSVCIYCINSYHVNDGTCSSCTLIFIIICIRPSFKKTVCLELRPRGF